jgi:hypothetical protein
MSKLTKKVFTSNGTFTAPSGITEVLLIGFGGGGGGVGGTGAATGATIASSAGAGGGGSISSSVYVTIVPNTAYTVTIGAGGTGSVGFANGQQNTDGNPGSDTTFGSTLATFSGASGGSQELGQTTGGFGGAPFKGVGGINLFGNAVQVATHNSTAFAVFPANGGNGVGISGAQTAGAIGYPNISGTGAFVGGAAGTAGTTVTNAGGIGGSGGGAGPNGNGAAGGNGPNGIASGTGNNGNVGANAAANSGAGGGGGSSGSCGSSGSTTGGNGGNGGSGQLTIIY